MQPTFLDICKTVADSIHDVGRVVLKSEHNQLSSSAFLELRMDILSVSLAFSDKRRFACQMRRATLPRSCLCNLIIPQNGHTRSSGACCAFTIGPHGDRSDPSWCFLVFPLGLRSGCSYRRTHRLAGGCPCKFTCIGSRKPGVRIPPPGPSTPFVFSTRRSSLLSRDDGNVKKPSRKSP